MTFPLGSVLLTGSLPTVAVQVGVAAAVADRIAAEEASRHGVVIARLHEVEAGFAVVVVALLAHPVVAVVVRPLVMAVQAEGAVGVAVRRAAVRGQQRIGAAQPIGAVVTRLT